MTQKGVLRKLIDLLKNELEVFSFEASYKEQGFIRKSQAAFFFYQLLIYNRTVIKTSAKGFLVEPYIWVGVKDIEKHYEEITLNTELKTDVDFMTVGNSIANILANLDGLYAHRNKSLGLHIFEEGHIVPVATQLLRQFKEVALPYCLKNSTVAMVDNIVNTKPDEYKVHMLNDNYRILKESSLLSSTITPDWMTSLGYTTNR